MRFTALSSVRRAVVRLTITSFSIAALLGIAALLVPGNFGSVQQRILLTTVIVGVTSVLALCYLTTTETAYRRLGALGGLAAVVSAATLLDMFWAHWQHDPGIVLGRTFGVSGIIALTVAQFCLLLVVVRSRESVALLLRSTLVAGTVLAGLLIATVLGWRPGNGAVRVVGVVAILDVLGTVTTMALGIFGGERRRAAGHALRVEIPEPLASQLRDRARASGQDPTALVLEAVSRSVESADV